MHFLTSHFLLNTDIYIHAITGAWFLLTDLSISSLTLTANHPPPLHPIPQKSCYGQSKCVDYFKRNYKEIQQTYIRKSKSIIRVSPPPRSGFEFSYRHAEPAFLALSGQCVSHLDNPKTCFRRQTETSNAYCICYIS